MGGRSSASNSTESSSEISDRRIVADGGSIVSAPEFDFSLSGGKNSQLEMNTSVIATDHGAVLAGTGVANNAVDANSVVSMFAINEMQKSSDAAIAAANKSAADAIAAAQASAAQAQAAAAASAAQSRASAQAAITGNQAVIESAFSYSAQADAIQYQGFSDLLRVAENFASQQKSALDKSQVLTAQAFETAKTTAAGALDQKTIVTIVLAGAAVLGVFAVSRKG